MSFIMYMPNEVLLKYFDVEMVPVVNLMKALRSLIKALELLYGVFSSQVRL